MLRTKPWKSLFEGEKLNGSLYEDDFNAEKQVF